VRVLALLITLLFGLNLFAYFYREQAVEVYQSMLQIAGVAPEEVPTILLVGEIQDEEQRTKLVGNEVIEQVSSNQQAGAERCWKFESDSATLKTLYERMRKLDIPVALEDSELQANSTGSSLMVAETENWQLNADFATQLRADWPDVLRSKVDCNTVALGADLH